MIIVSLFETLLAVGVTFALASVPAENASSKIVKGELFDINQPAKLLFTFEREPYPEGDKLKAVRTFKDLTGAVAAVEEIYYDHGQLKKMTVDQKQIGENGFFEIRDGRIYFSYTKGGKTKTDDEKLEEPLLVSDNIGAFWLTHWGELAKGETVKFRLPVTYRFETVGFKFQRDGEGTFEGKPVDIVKMSPSSMVIAMIVKPIYFSIERSDLHRVIKVVGRTVPKFQKDGKWSDLDVISVFHHSTKDTQTK